MNKNVMFSSNRMDWETPQSFFNELNKEFNFTLDVCALPHNTKCSKYFTPEINGLNENWNNEVCWMNPPYGREISKWVKKAYEESLRGATVVCLLPARTDTKWFHDFIYHKAKIRFIKGRLKFVGALNSAPFPSMVVIFKRQVK